VGFVVIAGAVVTVSVAALVVAELQLLVKTARYCFALSPDAVVKLYVVEVAPLMLPNVVPPSVETCHCTGGLPLAAALNDAVEPAQDVALVGLVVIVGDEVTVSIAADVVAEPQLFVKTAWYCLALSPDAVVKLYVVEVAPVTSLKVDPPSVETCHCTFGLPFAAALNDAVEPAQDVALVGLAMIGGGEATVSVAAVVVAAPQPLVKTARNFLPLSPDAVVKLYVVVVAPAMLPNVAPPSVETCHCTVGLPLEAALNDAVEPAQAVALAGFVVTAGAEVTVSVAAVVVAEPQLLVKTARYCFALSPDAVVKLYVADVAPVMLLKVEPPSPETCHCTVPLLPAAVNDAVVLLHAV
jgi:hypothetical protein